MNVQVLGKLELFSTCLFRSKIIANSNLGKQYYFLTAKNYQILITNNYQNVYLSAHVKWRGLRIIMYNSCHFSVYR